MRRRAWVLGGVVLLAVAAWAWASCDDAPQVLAPADPPAPVVAAAPASPEVELEPSPAPREVAAPDAGPRVWDLDRMPKIGLVPTTSLDVPPAIRKAFEAARVECENTVTRWFSGDGASFTDLELEATDAGVRVAFPGQTPMRRCITRLLKPQRFAVKLATPRSHVLFVNDGTPSKGALPEASDVVALLTKCLPERTAKSRLSLRTTASVRGNEVVVDRPLLESKDLDAWTRSCIELGLMRTVPFDDESRPNWSSVTIELETDERGANTNSHMTYEPP